MVPTSILQIFDAISEGADPHALESPSLDFKQEDPSLKRTFKIITDAVVCFANAEGGTLVLGVANAWRGDETPFLGVSEKVTVDSLRRGIFDRTSPHLSVIVQEHVVGARRLIEIVVPAGATLYATSDGTSTRRVGTDCVPFPPEQQRELLAARGQLDWSAAYTRATLDDASPNELRRLQRLLRAAGKEDVARQGSARVLQDLRIGDRDGRLTRAGLLLVGTTEALAREIPSYEYAYQYRPTPGSEATARFRDNQPLLGAVDSLLEAVQIRRSVHPLNLAGGVQVQLYDYSIEALRELVVNALVHRSFDLEGAVEVQHTPEALTISSPGGLVYGVTPDNILTHPSTPRHRLLFETVAALQVAERTGQGVDRAYRELLRVGKPPPRFEDTGSLVHALLEGGTGDDAFVRFINELPDEAGADVEVLLALASLRESRLLDAETLSTLIQRSPVEAQRVLARVSGRLALIEPTKRTATKPMPSYRLRPETLAQMGRAVKYHVRSLDSQDRKIVDHVREYGHITNATIRRMFDIHVYAARDILRDMQQRGVLEKSAEKGYGPGVQYGPGPNFPKAKG
jgi:ATP-dependent DNA helicase RecG